MHHDIFLQLLDGELYKAPIKNPQRIMDVGTGTGIWAIDVADKFPETEVIGVDLSPIQPQWVPPKCKFEVDDAEQEWPYPSNTFDFVHARNIVQGISDWPKLMSEVFRCTKPGGYVELAELGSTVYCDDDSMADDNAIKIYFETITYAMTKIGRPPANGEFLVRNLENAGFVDIVEDTKKQPIGPWPKDPKLKNVGAMVMLNTEVAFHSYGMAVFTRVLGMTTEEAERLCDAAFAAARNKNNHTYNLFHIVYARKPERC
ncbi:S-adenosyl-L-methionine-dependent methyltransferase [Wilcoxina mikolae CBS 423.85]|nr:S-adenosyl-L-methionine-dependent methyltransferase [Wilcoxina mikolae CBS 423.85]